MFKRKISWLMALVMMLSVVVTMPASARDGFVDEGYEVIDAAYNGSTYVVMAKNFSDGNHPAKIYVSSDMKNWTNTFSETYAKKAGSPNSKQSLLWWSEQQKFIASVGGKTMISDDGSSWSEWKVDETAVRGYSILDEKDGTVLLFGANGVRYNLATSITAVSDNLSVTGYTPGDMSVAGLGTLTDNTYTVFAAQAYCKFYTGVSYPQDFSGAIDLKSVPTYGWMALKNNGSILTVSISDGGHSSMTVKAGEEAITGFTAIGADDEVMVAGTSDGKLYQMAAPASRPSGEQQWQAVEVQEGTQANTEAIADIISNGEDSFFVITKTGKVYTMKKSGEGYTYADPFAVKEIGEVRISGENPFAGVKLMGGAYSPELKRYVAYGNDAEGKGHIFYSDDGVNWNITSVTGGPNFTTNQATKNIAVWWPAQKIFVVSTATQNNTQTCWWSEDGIKWSFMRTNGFGDEGDIAVLGDYLYTSYKGSKKAIRKFAALDGTFENVFYQRTDIGHNCTTMAISDDETPIILVGVNYGGTYINRVVPEGDTTTKAVMFYHGNTQPASQAKDVHWNKNIDKFVGVNAVSDKIYLTSLVETTDESTGEVTRSVNNETVATGASGKLVSVDTNGSSYLTGDENGKIYYSADANISTSSTFQAVQFDGMEENALPVTNIIVGAEGKYLVTVSDGTNSDVLIVNADGLSYQKASELASPSSVKAGDEFKIVAEASNYTANDASVTLISAIYDASGKRLIQVNFEAKTITANTEGFLTLDVAAGENVPDGAKVKAFVWDSIGGMKPVSGSFF